MNTPDIPIETGRHEIPSAPPGARVTTLDNGLTLIVREDHSAPVVSAQAWCMAGSVHEGKWLGAGMSHALEHMLFKGTTTRAGSRIDQEVQEVGGYMNAYTSFDRTVYHIDVPNTGARVAIDILCDVMQNATLPPDELEKEKQVILREMDMNTDDPGRRASRRLFETAYTRSPYRFTVIGYPDIFNELKPEDLRAYYREKYAPNNVFFVVAGDVQYDDVVSQIRQAYAGTKGKAMPPVVLPKEPTQTSARDVIEEAPIELGHFHFAWHIPELRHPDVPILDVLAVLLGSGRSSRLYQVVRETKGLVSSVDSWTYSPGDPGLFGVSAVVEPEKFSSAREAILLEVEAMKTNLVSPEELNKAVKQFTSATLSTRKTMQGQAHDLGANWIAASDLNFSERYLAAVKSITPLELQRVARQYLTASNRTFYALLPEGTAPKPASQISVSTDNPVRLMTLANGLRLLVKEDHRLPFVEFRAVFKGGVLAESPEKSGITQLMGRLLLKGTPTRTAEEIVRTIESIGGSIDSYGGNNSFGVNAEVLSGDFMTGLELVSDVILNPTFPERAFERERTVQLANLAAQKDQLLQRAFKSMRRAVFGPTGYGLDPLGTEATLRALNSADATSFHRKLTRPDNCVLAVFGDVRADLVRAEVEKLFGNWQSPPEPLPAISESIGNTPGARVIEFHEKTQAVLVLGFPGVRLFDPERYALEVLQEACSDLGSRLFLRIREELSLAYYVGAQNFLGLVPGYFAFYVGTMPDKADLAENELRQQAALLCSEGITAEELKRTKAKILGQKKIARQDLGALAMAVALDELYGMGYDHIEKDDALYEAVTLEQVQAAARGYLRPDSAVLTVLTTANSQSAGA